MFSVGIIPLLKVLLISLFLAAFVLGCGDVGNDGIEVYLKVGVAAKAFGNGEDAQPLILSRCGGDGGITGGSAVLPMLLSSPCLPGRGVGSLP